MSPLLRAGQTFEVARVESYRPHRGDVVVINKPSGWGQAGQQVYRVIAIGGDRIACCTEASTTAQVLANGGVGGNLILNGKALDESTYVPRGVDPSAGVSFPEQTVPDGKLWVMGDNRVRASFGSAGFLDEPGGPFVPASNVIGIYKP